METPTASSTTHMLVKMLDSWYKALNTLGTSVRVVFLDFSKAFDQINHNLLLDKFQKLDTPPCLLKWLLAFLQGRCQSVKIGDVISPPLEVNGSVPQGAIFGLECFIVMIDDLKANHPIYKLFDDSTPLEIVSKHLSSAIQNSIDQIKNWTVELNELKLETLENRRTLLCRNFYLKIQNENEVMHDILPVSNPSKYNLRTSKMHSTPKCRTSRYKNSFVLYAISSFLKF